MTEVGPVSYQNPNHPGTLHVMEESFIAEVIDPQTNHAPGPGQVGELVLSTLNRTGTPLLRYRTGDLVRPSTSDAAKLGRPELAIEGGILGRTDDMVLIRGVNIYPKDVENAIYGLSEVRDVAVIGIPDETWGEAVHAVIVRREGCELTSGEVIASCEASLPAYQVPRSVEFRDELPRNPSGKLLKRVLREEFWRDCRTGSP